MKAKKITFIGALLVMMLIVNTSFAQGNGRNARSTRNNSDCTILIPNLTEEQNKAINELQSAHWENINTLRNQRRSAFDERSKLIIRLKILDEKEAHNEKVLAILDVDQKKVFLNNQQGQRGNEKNIHRGQKNGKGNRSAINRKRENKTTPRRGNQCRN